MIFTDLLLTNVNELSEDEQEFAFLHQKIMHYGNAAAMNLIEMARSLREMHDTKKYEYANFETFGEYVESAVGIKERQAYNYIAILNKLPDQYLQLNAKLGITKLTMLASLSNKDREEIAGQIDETTSVRELQAMIDERDKKIEQLTMDLEEKESQQDEPTDAEKDLYNQLMAAQAEINRLKSEKVPKTDESPETKKQLAEAVKARKEAEKKLADEKAESQKKIDEANRLAQDLRKEKEDAENKAAELKAALEKQKEVTKPVFGNEMAYFKAKFEELQRVGVDMLNSLAKMTDEATISKCKNAMKKVIEGWNL